MQPKVHLGAQCVRNPNLVCIIALLLSIKYYTNCERNGRWTQSDCSSISQHRDGQKSRHGSSISRTVGRGNAVRGTNKRGNPETTICACPEHEVCSVAQLFPSCSLARPELLVGYVKSKQNCEPLGYK